MVKADGNIVAADVADGGAAGVAADEDHFPLQCYGLVCHIPHVGV
jgi:hypothetical protein